MRTAEIKREKQRRRPINKAEAGGKLSNQRQWYATSIRQAGRRAVLGGQPGKQQFQKKQPSLVVNARRLWLWRRRARRQRCRSTMLRRRRRRCRRASFPRLL